MKRKKKQKPPRGGHFVMWDTTYERLAATKAAGANGLDWLGRGVNRLWFRDMVRRGWLARLPGKSTWHYILTSAGERAMVAHVQFRAEQKVRQALSREERRKRHTIFMREWREQHKESIREGQRQRRAIRMADPAYRLKYVQCKLRKKVHSTEYALLVAVRDAGEAGLPADESQVSARMFLKCWLRCNLVQPETDHRKAPIPHLLLCDEGLAAITQYEELHAKKRAWRKNCKQTDPVAFRERKRRWRRNYVANHPEKVERDRQLTRDWRKRNRPHLQQHQRKRAISERSGHLALLALSVAGRGQ